MSSSDSDIEVCTGPLTLKDVYHFGVKQKRKPKSRSQSLNFIPSAILPVQVSKEDTSKSFKHELKETEEECNHQQPTSDCKFNSDTSKCELEGSEESIIPRSSTSEVYEISTADEGSNHSFQNTSNSCRSAYGFKGGCEAVEEDLINFSSYSNVGPSTRYEGIITDAREDSIESALSHINLRNNSPPHIKIEENDTDYFTCNESFQSKAALNESVITVSDEEEKPNEEGDRLEMSNNSLLNESIIILSDDDQEVVDESPDVSHTSLEANVNIDGFDLLDNTFERIEMLLSKETIPENDLDDATSESEIKTALNKEPEQQYLTPQKITSCSAKNLQRTHYKSGIPISTSKIIPKQPTNNGDLFKIPITPICKPKLRTLNTASPVAMYIKYSPQPLLLRKGMAATKSQNSMKNHTFTYKDVDLPKVFYNPSTVQVSYNEEKMKLPPSYCKLILDPLLHKHEQRMGQTMDLEMISMVLSELEKNPYSKLDESYVNVSVWTFKGAYEEAQAP